MSESITISSANTTSLVIARVAIGTSVAVLALLAILHILSPEFNPAWRMVSEYANGKYAWVFIASVLFMGRGFISFGLHALAAPANNNGKDRLVLSHCSRDWRSHGSRI